MFEWGQHCILFNDKTMGKAQKQVQACDVHINGSSIDAMALDAQAPELELLNMLGNSHELHHK